MRSKIPIKLLGSSFTIQVNEDPDYINRIISYLEDKIGKVKSSISVSDPLKISLLTSIFLTDELFREKSDLIKSRSDLEIFAEKQICSIDAVLNEEE